MSISLLGAVAGCLTTASFVPQVIHCWKTRNVAGISASMYCAFIAGLIFWIAYGWALGSWPIVAFNVVTLALAASVLFMKWRFSNR